MEDIFFLNEKLRGFEHVIVYGIGRAGREIHLKLLQRNVKVDFFGDSNPDNFGKKILNIPVVNILELLDMCEDAAVIAGGLHALTIAAELEELGFRHIFYDYANAADFIHLERDETI